MNYSYKYWLLILAFLFCTDGVIAQKKSAKKTKSSISKTLTLKKKKTNKKKSKKKIIKKRARLNNIDTIIFKDLAQQTIAELPPKKLDTVPEKVVTILSAFKPQLKNVAKISFTTATAQNDTTSLHLNYELPNQNLSFQYQPVPLVPRTYKSYPTKVLRNLATLKIGYGNYLHQLVDLNSTLIDKQSNAHTVNLKYESSQGDLNLQRTRDMGIKYLSDLKINDNNHIKSQLFYQNTQRYRYGLVEETTTLPNSNFEQAFSHVGGTFKWVNTNEKNLFSLISPILKIEHFKGTENANNTWFEIYNPLSLKFDNNLKFNFDFSYNYNQYQLANGNKINNAILRMDPSFEMKKWNTDIKIGVSPTIANGLYTFTPALFLSKKLKDTSIKLLAGWQTLFINNNYTSLVLINPWIMAPTDMKITTQEKKNVGVEFNATKNLQYGFGLSLNDYKNLPLFNRVINTVQTAQMGLRYQSLFEYRAITVELEGHLWYQFSDKLLFKNNFKYIQFNSIQINDKPWGITPIELNSAITWSPNKKLAFDGGLNYWSGATFSNNNQIPFDLSNSLVLNAGFSYQFTRLWKVWAKGENLLDKPYQRWADYPSLGLQLIAGVVYSFHK